MLRREKGYKRYADQRERRFTDPLIREDELARVREAQQRLSRGVAAGVSGEREIINSNKDSA